MHNAVNAALAASLSIVLVEDDEDLREELADGLRDAGFVVRTFGTAAALYRDLLLSPCHIAVLDVNLPGEDGYEIVSHLRQISSRLGIVMLSGRARLSDRVAGLARGADLYLAKPVDLVELQAVLLALGRRVLGAETGPVGPLPAPASAQGSSRPGAGTVAPAVAIPPPLREAAPPAGWALVNGGWTLKPPTGEPLSLSPAERAFLLVMFKRPNQPVSRDTIVVELGHDPYEFDFHSVEALVSRLRRKLRENGQLLPLRAVRGEGYLLELSPN